MKHRRLLIGSILAIPTGFILWFVVGPIIAMAGIYSYYQGSWPFGHTTEATTVTYWVGVSVSVLGICLLAFGAVGIVLAFLLEYLDRGPRAS